MWIPTTQENVAGGVPSGTSFPGSPSGGDLFYRTDSRIIYEYNSTVSRWLSIDLKYVPLAPGGSLPGSGASTGDYGFLPLWEDVYVESWVATTFVPSTNDGSNFWTVLLKKIAAPNTVTTVDSFTTAADTVGTWTVHNRTIAAMFAASSYVSWNMQATKTSAPGNIYFSAALLVRSAG